MHPEGKPLGTAGSRGTIREVSGGPEEVQRLFDELSAGGTPAPRPKYPGTGVQLPDGGWVGLRMSDEFGLTLDVDVPGVSFTKVHFTR